MSSRRWTATQKRILAAARELLEGGGTTAVRLEDVAGKAGVSRQAIYLNFGSRPGLLAEVVEFIDQEERFPERASRAAVTGTAVESLDAWLALWARHLPRVHGIARTLLADRAFDEAAQAAWSNRMDALLNACRHLVGRLAEEGKLAPPWSRDEAADWLWALLSVQVFEALTGRGWSSRRYADRLRRVVHAALVTGTKT